MRRFLILLLIGVLAMPAWAQSAESDPNQKLQALGIPVPRLVRIAGSTFEMGNGKGTPAEQPVHKVTLSSYWMAESEITVDQYAAFVADTGYRTEPERDDTGVKSGGWILDGATQQMVHKPDATWRNPYMKQAGDHPVVLVTWNDANAYAEWLTKKSGLRIALPTEAQWEFVARAGATEAWTKENSGGGTHPVKQKPANSLGLYDLLGNVWEWTRDWFADYASADLADPIIGFDQGKGKNARGGSWNFSAEMASPTLRQPGHGPAARAQDLGFRVAMDTSKRIRVSSGISGKNLVHKVVPIYPAAAKQRRIQGTVKLSAVLAIDGAVQTLDYLSGPKELVQSSVAAVSQWRYRPYLLNGEPVEVETTIDVTYTITTPLPGISFPASLPSNSVLSTGLIPPGPDPGTLVERTVSVNL